MAGKACARCYCASSIISFLLGFVLIAGSVCVYVLHRPDVAITNQVENEMTIQKGHVTYEQLQSPTLNIAKEFFFFNFSNCERFARTGGGETPKLVEIGPYSYSEERAKSLTETANKTELNYTQSKTFKFDSSKSGQNLSDSDTICTINIPLATLISKMKDNTDDRRKLNNMIKKSKAEIFVCLEVKDLIWNYTDKFLEEASKEGVFPSSFSLQMNNSLAGQSISTVNTGIPDISEVGQFIQWNGQRQLDIWREDANDINGTEGLFFKPGLKVNDNLTIFNEDLMRSFHLVYFKLINHRGIPSHRYRVNNATYRNSRSEPKNANYFSFCPNGMFNLRPSRPDKIPLFGSKPHFLDGDPLLLQSVSGLTPVRNIHDSVIDVEPITGVSVYSHRRLQLNIQVNKTDKAFLYSIKQTENITGYDKSGVLYFPVVHINERAEIDSKFKAYLEKKGLTEVFVSDIAVPVGFAAVVILGAIFIIFSLGFVCGWRRRSGKKNDYYNI